MTTYPLWNDRPATTGEKESVLDYYEPYGQRFSKTAVLILPGGGYQMLSAQEGEGFAGFFRLWGFHSFVLHYRLGSRGHRHPSMLEDAARAMRFLRSRQEEFGFERIVVIGSSAGGHLAATLLTKWDSGSPGHSDPLEQLSSRPDLGILCYPVITMTEHTHGGSRSNLLGDAPDSALIEDLSAELHVDGNTPPCFIWHTCEDEAVPVENALLFAGALRKAGVPFELHIYQEGVHGLGMKDGIPWVKDCARWLALHLEKSS